MGVLISLEEYRARNRQKRKKSDSRELTEGICRQYKLNEEQSKLIEERPELMYFDIRKIL